MEHTQRRGPEEDNSRSGVLGDSQPPRGAPDAGNRVVAVVITWRADLPRLSLVLSRLVAQVHGVVVVDNGSPARAELRRLVSSIGAVQLLELPTNLGIGAALNIGVKRAIIQRPEWILTVDQDTVIGLNAVAEVVDAYEQLPENLKHACGILAMRCGPPGPGNAVTRWGHRRLVVGRQGRFAEKRLVITSGNLVRAALARDIGFNEPLFVDQVDFDFCATVRRRGFRVLEYERSCMDHRLGRSIDLSGQLHSAEGPQRLYYIARNSTFLLLRRRLQVGFYLSQIISWSGAYIIANGAHSGVRCAAIVALGLFDGTVGRLGKREYRLLSR